MHERDLHERRARLFTLALGALAAACGASDPPRLEVTALPAGVPMVAKARAVEARFRLHNAGGRVLLLDGLVPACGCEATSRLPATLAAGASTTFAVACRSSRTLGEVAREIRLQSSDPASPDTTIRVTLAAEPPGPEPPALYLGYVAVGESMTYDIVLPIAVAPETLPAPAEPTFAIEPLPARPDGRPGVRVRFTPRTAGVLRADLDLGPVSGRVPVIGVGHRSALAFPPEVRLPPSAGAGALPPITLKGLGDAPLAITGIEYPPGLTGELRAVIPGRQFRLLLRTLGRAVPDVGAEIRLRTGSHEEPMLVIPVLHAQGDGVPPPTLDRAP